MDGYKGKAARWQQQDKEDERMNKTEFIKVRCTLEEKQRIKSRAESTGRKFSDYCREILLNGEVTAVPKMTDNEREAIAILRHTGKFYGQVSNLIKVKDEDWLHIMFLYELNKNGISIERMKNKQGKVYGLKFSCAGQSFKASEIGREFGYRSLQKNFEATNKEESKKPHQITQGPTEKNAQPNTDYQLVPPSRSSISRGNDTPRAQNPIGAVADTIVSAADEVVEGLGDLITPTTQGDDYAETAWQRKLRNQANRKKIRGRGI